MDLSWTCALTYIKQAIAVEKPELKKGVSWEINEEEDE
jgi:hypothetical protein